MKQNKYTYMLVLQGNYGYGHGWEDLTAEKTYSEMKVRRREYRENEPGTPTRVIKRRVLNEVAP
jgi:hypothetical protein